MSFIKNIFNSQNSGAIEGWKNLSTEEELHQLIENSVDKPVFIFKHSTRCGISVGAKSRLEEWSIAEEQADFYYLDLLEYRPISNQIESLLGVIHQSPQVILVKNKKAVWSTTHHAISADALKDALTKH